MSPTFYVYIVMYLSCGLEGRWRLVPSPRALGFKVSLKAQGLDMSPEVSELAELGGSSSFCVGIQATA